MRKSRRNRADARRKQQQGAGKAPQAGGAASGRLAKSPVIQVALFAVAAILLASFILFQSPAVPDRDVYYHLGHAKVYAEHGPFYGAFPWVAYSVISRFAADIWYGFHLLLIPFTVIGDPVLQVKAAGIFVMSLFLVVFYLTLRRSGVALPYLWPMLVVFLSGPFMGRMSTTRPHVITLALGALMLSLSISGSVWAVLAVSLLMTFVHLTFFWFGLFIAVVVAIVRARTEGVWGWRKPLAAAAGAILGWALRPNPMGAVQILKVQTFELAAAKQEGLAGFGSEMTPVDMAQMPDLLSFIGLWAGVALIGVIVILAKKEQLGVKDRTWFWASLLLSAPFFLLMVGYSRRAIDQWGIFGIIVVALGFTYFLDWKEGRGPKKQLGLDVRIAGLVVGGVVALYMIWSAAGIYKQFVHAPWMAHPRRFEGAAKWVEANSAPDEIVFHASWDVFPELFFWNKKNRYIGGMDPVFQYSYDKGLYWKARNMLIMQDPSRTWGTQETDPLRAEDTYRAIREDFGAAYVFAQKNRPVTFFNYLLRDPRFVLKYEDAANAIFEVTETDERAGGQ